MTALERETGRGGRPEVGAGFAGRALRPDWCRTGSERDEEPAADSEAGGR